MATLDTVTVNEGKVLKLWFEVSQLGEPTQIAPDSSEPVLEDDKEITRYTTSSTGEQITLIADPSYALGDGAINFTYVSDNPTEIGVDLNGNIAFQVPPQSTASATITITCTQGELTTIRTVSVTLTVTGAAIIDVIDGGVFGSARKALSDPMDTALSGANPATQQAVYTSQDHSTPSYVRNTSFFLSGSVGALTCVSPWNSLGGNTRAGTAITKRHAMLAHHYKYGIGTVVRFVTADNTVVQRTVVQADRIVASGEGTDAWMVLFDSDLPSSITPCKLFPSGYETYLPSGASVRSFAATDIPILALDQEEKGVVLDLHNIDQSGATLPVLTSKPTLADRLAFYESIISGDSGNPLFSSIGTELWLMTCFFGPGPFYGGLVTELNAMIVTLDTLQNDLTGYTVTEGDLSAYTTYP